MHGIVLEGDGQTLTNVTVFKSDWAGIETLGATNLTLDHPAFWLTGDSSLIFHGGPNGPSASIFVQDPLIVNPGDDGVAIETWISPNGAGCPGTPGPLQHDIWVNGETYMNSGTPTAGHGIAILGGTNITFTNFSITNPPGAGIYVVDGSVFCDTGSNHVKMLTGTITNANTWDSAPPAGQGAISQGAVVVQTTTTAANQVVDNIDMENITLANTAPGVPWQVWDSPYCSGCPPPTNVTLKNFTFSGTSPITLFNPIGGITGAGTTPPRDYSISGWQVLDQTLSLLRLVTGQIVLG